MNSLLVGFLLAVGAGGWIYSKAYKASGGLTQKALIVAGISGLVIFIISWSVLDMLFGD